MTGDVARGDLTVPESLHAALSGIRAVFLVWTAGPAAMSAVIDRLAARARGRIAAAIGRPIAFEEISPGQFRRETAGRWPPAAVVS